jgi:endonuclease G
MPYLSPEEIQEIHSQAVRTPGLLDQWRNLLIGIPIGYTSTLPNIDANKSMGLIAQLDAMNNVPCLKGGVVPLERWLKNAAYFSEQFVEGQNIFDKYSIHVAEIHCSNMKKIPATSPPAKVPSLTKLVDVSEKVVFVNDMVSFGFLAAASRVGGSVARLIVPRYQGRVPALQPSGTEQVKYFGTGWLIGPKHLITNYHVINARDPGEAEASSADFELQGKKTIVQFDYNAHDSVGDEKNVREIVATSKSLDYCVLELAQDTGRDPLKLLKRELHLPFGSYVPVNIIQHPGGQPKKLGIRNNLLASIKDDDIAYFTDTEFGSSGSPVCTDDWHVVGLHKAYSISFGEFEYLGKKTSWVNIGTRIDRIIADLQNNHPGIWHAIGSTVVN